MNHSSYDPIQKVLDEGARDYFSRCHHDVDGFVNKQFNCKGAWQTNQIAFGWDLVRAPLNIMWAPFYVLIQLALLAIKGFKFKSPFIKKIITAIDKIPSGLTTDVQRQLAKRVMTQLLKLNTDPTDPRPTRLDECISDHLIKSFIDDSPSNELSDRRRLIIEQTKRSLKDTMNQYAITRMASADIANSLLSSLIGLFAFQKFTPGGLAIGFSVAALVAKKIAISDFVFGERAGALFYDWFPAQASLSVTVMSVLAVLVTLAIFASFSGLITDPIQAALGIHQRRLKKFIKHLETDYMAKSHGSFRPKDQYFARILELLDVAKTQIG